MNMEACDTYTSNYEVHGPVFEQGFSVFNIEDDLVHSSQAVKGRMVCPK